MYRASTKNIEVEVVPEFLEDRSNADQSAYFWAYHITIRNGGRATVQLRSRHWKIVDAAGRLQEVRGPGVVGEEPILAPGESFSYTSGVPLKTPSGFMSGSYQMQNVDGSRFDAVIPAFSLDLPGAAGGIN